MLFTIYLEEALKEVRKVLPQETKPCKVAYADDVDFVDNKSFANIDLIDPIITKYNLKLNKDKTKHTKDILIICARSRSKSPQFSRIYFFLILGSICFSLALNFKQMALYYSPAIFPFLLGRCFQSN